MLRGTSKFPVHGTIPTIHGRQPVYPRNVMRKINSTEVEIEFGWNPAANSVPYAATSKF